MDANASGTEVPGGVSLEYEQVVDLALSAGRGVVWSLDLSTDRLSWRPGLDDLLGVPGASDADIRALLAELINPLVVTIHTTDTWKDLDLEKSHLTTDGETRWLRFTARRGEGHVLGIVHNVTDRHEDRRELADIADRYRLLVELSPDMIAVQQDGEVVYANPAAVRFAGGGLHTALLGKPITQFVEASSVPDMLEQLSKLDVPGATSEPTETMFVRPDGSRVPMEVTSVRTTWAGRPAFQIIMRDVSAQQAAESALRFQAALVQHVSDAIVATDSTSRVTSWNAAAETIYGLPSTGALGRYVGELVGAPLDPAAIVRAGGVVQETHRAADGTSLSVRVSAAEMDDGYVLVCADETARRRAERQYSTVVAALDEGVVVIGHNGLLISANPAAERILGVPESSLSGVSPLEIPVYDEAGRRLAPSEYPSAQVRRSGTPQHGRVLRVLRRDGRNVWLSTSCRPMNPEDSGGSSFVLSFMDITERRAIGERLEHDATHDPLTGLANRMLVLDELGARLHGPSRTATAVLFIDLDKFKVINDSLGHSVGDRVLKIAGERLRRAVRRGDLIGRLGGDEFVVIASGVHGEDDVRAMTDHLRDSLTRPISVDGRKLHVDASIGIVLAAPGDPRAADELLRDADVAMYQAKTLGRSRLEFFDVELRRRMQRRLRLEQDLRDAVRLGRLWAAYQPVVDLASERMIAVEGLLRWTHPVHGAVPPAEFIPLAEESDLINQLGSHILRVTTSELAARRAAGSDVDLKINLSTRQLDDPALVGDVERTLRTTKLPARALCLEITESELMRDTALASETLGALRQLGVRLAIDDFGTGYSSLAQLQRLTLDTLKIDRSFVMRLGESADAEAIVRSIIAMAHAVKLTVVAEGVETPEQVAALREMGCDQAQGYYFGKPVPADELWAY